MIAHGMAARQHASKSFKKTGETQLGGSRTGNDKIETLRKWCTSCQSGFCAERSRTAHPAVLTPIGVT
jgi:hypothetical protein